MENLKKIVDKKKWNKIEKIEKGWSRDEKYYVESNKNKYILRVSKDTLYEKKKEDARVINKIAKKIEGIPRVIEVGRLEDNRVYMLLEWIEGEPLEEKLGEMSLEKQYNLGYMAGEILKKIHTITRIDDKGWEKRYLRKIERNIIWYDTCPIKVDGMEKIKEYIEKNKSYLNKRPMCFHHGDYHIGNMIISDKGRLGIIDFDRADYGDPWEEFNRITWCVNVSEEFARGRVDGYFKEGVSKEFFKLLALYIGCNQLASIPWAMGYGKGQVEVMIKEAKKVMGNYNNYLDYIPNWYR